MSKPAQNTKVGYLASEVATKPMEKLLIDFVGKLPRSVRGNSYALVVVDAFSKFSWIFPLREATSPLAVASLKSFFSSCGPCHYIVSDNARQFTSKLLRISVLVWASTILLPPHIIPNQIIPSVLIGI